MHSADYSPDELVTIVTQQAAEAGYVLSLETRSLVQRHFTESGADQAMGNGRLARKVLETMMTRQAGRLSRIPEPTRDELTLLQPDDLPPISL